MNIIESFENDAKRAAALKVALPFIWPEARFLAGLSQYADTPPSRHLFTDADLVSGLLVGPADGAIRWLEELFGAECKQRICLVLVLYPASPTREHHLRAICKLQDLFATKGKTLEIRLLAMSHHFEHDCERVTLPPTVIQALNSEAGRTTMTIGSVGDAGFDPAILGSVNFVFNPDDANRNAWRVWFQYVFSSAAALSESTIQIPYLVPAMGDLKAAGLWEEYERVCQQVNPASGPAIKVDPEGGGVEFEGEGKEVVAWDEGRTALDPLAQVFQRVYASGWLVTVDEATRIKPLTIPVKATLLGQRSERTVGALKQRQSFSLQVLDDDVDKAVEKCRKVTDVMELLTYPLSQGNRWLPETAKGLLDREFALRNEQGQKVLKDALGDDIRQFIAKRTDAIRTDLNEMYRQLGEGSVVPDDKFRTVLDEVVQRLRLALDARVTPRAAFNRIAAPDLTAAAPDENWNQPLSLLVRSARILRESLTDRYFPFRFTGLSFSVDDFRKSCDVFGDVIVSKQETNRARTELQKMEEIISAPKPAKEKCQEVWYLVRGGLVGPKR